ncbi:MAG: polysaccharide pyruvyl transferase family protein [Sphingomonadales bacterium]
MAELASRHGALADIVPRGAPVIYADVPVHYNVGDLLIHAGTEALAARHGWRVTHRFSVHDYRHFLDAVTDEHVLLLHGGGNLGDLWPEHEALRQLLLRRFRNKTVVLPQSMHFQDRAAAESCGEAYREHPDCTLFVRDDASRRVAGAWMGVSCEIMPDMAHALWRSKALSSGASGTGELLMRRTDQEAPGGRPMEGMDWNDILTRPDRLLLRALVEGMGRNRSPALQRLMANAWRAQAARLVGRAAALFGRHARIRSDRLHAVLLGCLLDKNVAAIDNSYGKLSSYFDTWMPGMVPVAGRA